MSQEKRARRRRRAGQLALGALGAGIAAVAGLLADAWVPMGTAPEGERLARMQASPQWSDGIFVNPQPMWNDFTGMLTGFLRASPYGSPDAPLPVVRGDRGRFAAPPETGLRVTWLGHSTQVIELDGVTVLTDPIFGGRAGPFDWVGPAPWYAPPIPLEELPVPDAVLISHDHYDHLQVGTIKAMADWDTRFIAPLGVGAHLAYWGVPEERITEVDWWEEVRVGELRVVTTPSRHASGRQVLDQNRTLWAGYALIGPEHRVYFSGDTGLFPDLKRIGEELGPFDLTMFEVGAYDRAWPDWHLGPEQAVTAHRWVRGEVLMPIHWGLWNLALHGWTEPIERVLVEVGRQGVDVVAPRPGASFELDPLPPLERWWPEVPWETAEEHPVVARGFDY
jgi:L-ascorbate metabolism protein UlaG (beta-lactamase superfamily)